ncbi:hypothetical protein QC761_306155 [Podospora bellae-mahoneyi]|uniref:Uncharacterized protein n=1 Tax=Podospora bellae-mahoneyi TaxID=2093777 RepID=A0ABR0FP73_9PEZI|nr:hypothetical protein QC761_306155 [Podospora bellae-mahoneyi]
MSVQPTLLLLTTTGPKFSGIQGKEDATNPFFPMPITTFATSVTMAAPKFSGIVGADCMGLGTASGGALDDNRTLDPAVTATVIPLPDGGFWTIV